MCVQGYTCMFLSVEHELDFPFSLPHTMYIEVDRKGF